MPPRSGGEAAGKGQAWALKVAGELHPEWSLHPRGRPEKPKAVDQKQPRGQWLAEVIQGFLDMVLLGGYQ